MKRLFAILMLTMIATGIAVAAEPDPIADAMADAQIDLTGYKATGWGALASGASLFVSPLLGGGAVIVAANMIEPDVPIPTRRLATAQDAYETSNDLMLYQAQYQESTAGPIQKARSKRAWVGTGIATGVYVAGVTYFVIVYISILTSF